MVSGETMLKRKQTKLHDGKGMVVRFIHKKTAKGRFYLNLNSPDEAYVYALEIYHRYRNRGLGQRMMKEFVRLAKKMGLKKVTLGVFRNNLPAIKIYTKSGF